MSYYMSIVFDSCEKKHGITGQMFQDESAKIIAGSHKSDAPLLSTTMASGSLQGHWIVHFLIAGVLLHIKRFPEVPATTTAHSHPQPISPSNQACPNTLPTGPAYEPTGFR